MSFCADYYVVVPILVTINYVVKFHEADLENTT
jgi:hypothetical protein